MGTSVSPQQRVSASDTGNRKAGLKMNGLSRKTVACSRSGKRRRRSSRWTGTVRTWRLKKKSKIENDETVCLRLCACVFIDIETKRRTILHSSPSAADVGARGGFRRSGSGRTTVEGGEKNTRCGGDRKNWSMSRAVSDNELLIGQSGTRG